MSDISDDVIAEVTELRSQLMERDKVIEDYKAQIESLAALTKQKSICPYFLRHCSSWKSFVPTLLCVISFCFGFWNHVFMGM